MSKEKSLVTINPHSIDGKEVYDLSIGINSVGTYTESELCHIVQQIDNKIMQ